MLNKIACLVLALLATASGSAQRYAYRAGLPQIAVAGFYKITIRPEIAARAAADGRDLRILDARGKEVPYMKEDSRNVSQNNFYLFSIVSNGRGKDGRTHIILRNDTGRPVDELAILIRNTGAARKMSLSGSSDGKRFFSISDSTMPDAMAGRGQDTIVCMLKIPRTTYPYLQLGIFDNDLLPLDVLGAGIYKGRVLDAHYTDVPSPSFRQTDSNDHKSYIRLHFDAPYRVDRLGFLFGGARYFRRAATLYDGDVAAVNFTVDQTMPATVWPGLHASDVLLVVNNEDNPALHLQSVSAAQLEQCLIAYLESSGDHTRQGYVLSFGDSALSAPVYDLPYFKDSISRLTLPGLVPGSIQRVQITPARASHVNKPFLGKGTMWAIIIVVLIGLIAATAGLMRQLQQRS